MIVLDTAFVTDPTAVSSISSITVIGAWVGGLGIIFAALSFSFGMINPRLFRVGLTWLIAADAGLFTMLATLILLIESATLWIFTVAGVIILIALTVFVVMVLRLYASKGAENAIEDTRRRIEF
jgi:hypothetical protein